MTNFERILTWIMEDLIQRVVENDPAEINGPRLEDYQRAIKDDPIAFKIFVDCLFETEPHDHGEGTQPKGYEYAWRVCKAFVEEYPHLADLVTVYVYS